ncbi:MAG: type II toxin-antitoxin system mRNA interferase toxin, RelE/StbE family [Candidatus ainarchaeum sp.]|nr:type II toxin-antitoxin system mRNA interferase toxin, RelE/StbE family [Candidatus ainarchaeum sp.]
MYEIRLKKSLEKVFEKLAKKDIVALEIIRKKVKQIKENPYQFKPLSNNLKNTWRVHIKKSFVLTYKISEEKKIVELVDYDHHDNIYKN